uniref:Uncharacterized protein n=1 Tax=Timema genevievae TaxID=629358 RepID=A0A7R9KBQ3_TIMGE|nr:unnamed protein product [Timema genevievae]
MLPPTPPVGSRCVGGSNNWASFQKTAPMQLSYQENM